jgi:hypothetical protein
MLAAKYSPHLGTHTRQLLISLFYILFYSIYCMRTSAQPSRFMLYLIRRQPQEVWGCSWRQQGQIANRQAEVNRDVLHNAGAERKPEFLHNVLHNVVTVVH